MGERINDERTTKPVAHEPGAAKTDEARPPAKESVDRLAAGSASGWRLAHAPVIELADDVVGVRSHHDAFVYALDRNQQGPRIRAAVTGDPAIRLARAPLYLPGTGTFDPGTAIQIDFVPSRTGAHEATLEVDVQEAPLQTVTIPIRAWARLPGGKTRAEEQAAAERASSDTQVKRSTAAAHADAEARIARHDAQAVHHHHQGHVDRLDRQRGQLEASMLDLSTKRGIGITRASENIGEFKRMKPVPEQPSLLSTLAWAAVDTVTAGLARNVSNLVRGPVEKLLSKTITDDHSEIPYPMEPTNSTVPPSAALVGFIVEGVRDGAKRVGKGVANKIREDEPAAKVDHVDADKSIDAKAAFIAQQSDAFLGDAHQSAFRTSRFVYDSLLDVLDVKPDAAFAVMDTMLDGIRLAFGPAIEAQRSETFRNWIRYLTQTSVGTADAETARKQGHVLPEDGTMLTDMASATRAPKEHQPSRTFDGLVDLTFAIDEGDPRKPAIVRSAKIRGVREEVAKTLRAAPLLASGVPVRAIAEPSRRAPVNPLTITRDEVGNIAYDDQMTATELHASSWLSRKAGLVHASAAGQREGARMLIEDDLMRTPLDTLDTDGES